MADTVTKKELQEVIDKAVDKVSVKIIDDLSNVIQVFATQVDDRFNQLEARVDKLEKGIDRLTNTLDAFIKRLDAIETDNTARDAQLARLERWIEQVAAKAGVKLEY